jgi:hypothetical protein
MNLTLPVDHGSSDIWDGILDTVFNTLDAHSHLTGSGVPIQSAALKINGDVQWNFGGTHYAIVDALALDLFPTSAASVSGYSSALFTNSADNNLYFRNAASQLVQITSGSTINVTVAGAIGGDYGPSGYLLDATTATDYYHFYQEFVTGVRQYAGVAHGQLDIFEQKAAPAAGVPANRVRQKSPAGLAASYDLTWLTALPAANTLMMVDNTGAITSPATPTLANNANFKLQGTGYIQRGTRITTVPVVSSFGCIQLGGTISTGSIAGCNFAVSTTAQVPINVPDADDEAFSISSVTVQNNIVGTGTVSLQLFMFDWATGLFISIGSASALAINSSLTITPTSPTVLTPGNGLYVKVITAGTNSGTVFAARVTSTAP